MALQDSNPERRNLLVLSLSIIVFYLAGGEFTDNDVRLQIVNVHFTKPEILAYFVWGLLAWFAFRYWLVNQGSWKQEYYSDLSSMPKHLYERYALKKLELGTDYSHSYYEDRHWISIDVSPSGITLANIYKKEDGSQGRENFKVNTWARYILMIVGTIYALFKRPNLSGHFSPYALFLFAIWLGLGCEL